MTSEITKVELERKSIRSRTDIAFREFEQLIKQGWGLASGNSIRIEANGYVQVGLVRGVVEETTENGGSIKVLDNPQNVEDVVRSDTELLTTEKKVVKRNTPTKKVDVKVEDNKEIV